MHKLGEVLAVLILLTSLAGCSFDSPTNWVKHYLVSSDDAFAVCGKMVYVSVTVSLPVLIYNPNAYPIQIDVDENQKVFDIPSHQSITITEDDI